MPRIQTYDNRIAAPHADNLGMEAAEQGGRRIEESYSQLGGEIGRAVNAYGDYQTQKFTTDFYNQVPDFEAQQRDGLKQAMANGMNAEDYTKNVYQPALEKLGADAPTSQAAEFSSRYKAGMVDSFSRTAFGLQADQDKEAGVSAVQGNTDKFANLASQNPDSVDDFARMNATGIAATALSHGLPQEHVAALQQDANKAVYGSAFKGVVARAEASTDPDAIAAAQKSLQDDKWTSNVAPDLYAQGMDQLTKAQKSVAAVQYAGVAAKWDDMRAAVRAGDPDAITWTQQNMQNVMGTTPKERAEEIARRQQGFADDQSYAKQATQYQDKTLPELRDMSGAIAPPEAERSAADKGAVAAQDVAKGIVRAYDSDPVKYMTTNNPAVGSSFQAFQKNPTPQTFQTYAAKITAAESQFNPGQTTRIMPPDYVNKVSTAMAAIDQTPQGAQQAASIMSDLKNTTGTFYNKAVHELQAAGAISPAQFAGAQMMGDARSWALGNEVLRASTVSEKLLTETSGVSKEVSDKAAANALNGLLSTFSDTTDGHVLVGGYANAISDVLRSRGVKPADMATQAGALAQTMILNRFNIQNNMRIPKEFDSSDVVDGANNIQAHIDQHDLVIPASFSNLGNAVQKDAYQRDIKDFGHWSTNGRGDGAMLYDQYGAPVYEKVKGHAVQVEIPFESMANTGKKIRSPLNNAERVVMPGTFGHE